MGVCALFRFTAGVTEFTLLEVVVDNTDSDLLIIHLSFIAGDRPESLVGEGALPPNSFKNPPLARASVLQSNLDPLTSFEDERPCQPVGLGNLE